MKRALPLTVLALGICGLSFAQVKNLAAPTYRVPSSGTTSSEELTGHQARRLAAHAKTREDHLKLAAYYSAQADAMDAKGAAYEEAAAEYRHDPTAKNMMSPTTASRYEYLAHGFRDQASYARSLASSQQQLVANFTVSPTLGAGSR
jgi:hypothetical protein